MEGNLFPPDFSGRLATPFDSQLLLFEQNIRNYDMNASSRSPLRRWNSTTACSLMRPLPVRCAILYGWRRCVEVWRRWAPGFRWFGCIRIWRFAENGCRCAPPSGILGNWRHWEDYVGSRNFNPPESIPELIVIDNSGSETYLEPTQALAHQIEAERKEALHAMIKKGTGVPQKKFQLPHGGETQGVQRG